MVWGAARRGRGGAVGGIAADPSIVAAAVAVGLAGVEAEGLAVEGGALAARLAVGELVAAARGAVAAAEAVVLDAEAAVALGVVAAGVAGRLLAARDAVAAPGVAPAAGLAVAVALALRQADAHLAAVDVDHLGPGRAAVVAAAVAVAVLRQAAIQAEERLVAELLADGLVIAVEGPAGALGRAVAARHLQAGGAVLHLGALLGGLAPGADVSRRVIADRVARFFTSDTIKARLAFLEAKEQALEGRGFSIDRVPTFCSGCPHNTSTHVPEGSRALAGIGCHTMAVFRDPTKTNSITQMGGEGAA